MVIIQAEKKEKLHQMQDNKHTKKRIHPHCARSGRDGDLSTDARANLART